MEQILELAKNLPEILEALLACLGGLKILARYTPFKWDDRVFGAAESSVQKAKAFLPKKKK